MEFNFKEFLLLSEGAAGDVPLDQADVDYLRQFPTHYQQRALEARYGSLLCKSIDAATSDYQMLNLPNSIGGEKTFNVDTGITDLIEKLNALGFDLRKECLEAPFGTTAHKLLYKWRQLSGGKDLKPNIVAFRGRWPKTEDAAGIEKYKNTKNDLKTFIEKRVDKWFKYYSNPNTSLHINYYYWKEKRQELINLTMEYLAKKYANPSSGYMGGQAKQSITTPTGLRNLTNQFIEAQFGRGYVTIRRIKSAVQQGLNIPELFQQGKTLKQIIKAIEYGALHVKPGRPATWKFGNKLKQDELDPAPNSKFAQYGKNLSNLGGKRGRPEVPWDTTFD